MKESYLILEDGAIFKGASTHDVESVGEVVFNTSHSGYEEMATDPSYYNQILVTTAVMQGNYGAHQEFWESEKLHIKGFVCLEVQNSSRDKSWQERLKDHNIPLLSEVDTRTLVLHLREQGAVWGGVFNSPDKEAAFKKIKEMKDEHLLKDWTEVVSTSSIHHFDGLSKDAGHVGVLDFGCKKNIIRELIKRFSKVSVFPSKTSKEEILSSGISGLLLSNGPGDPGLVGEPVEVIKNLLGELPVMGICMGHQLLGRALGGDTFKLKYGHRGANHPIKDLDSGFIFMSSQNHGYALKESFKTQGTSVSHLNLNDNTVAGIQLKEKDCFSVQFHPESHPGPHEAEYLFDRFSSMVNKK